MYQPIGETVITPPTRKNLLIRVAGCSFGLLMVALSVSRFRQSSTVLPNLAVPYPWEAVLQLAPDGQKIYQEWQYEQAPAVRRLPTRFTTNRVDLFSHPKVLQQMTYALPGTKYLCSGPEGNIYIWKNDADIQADLLSADGYTVFNLDCRDELANSLVAFIVVIDMNGDIAGVHMPHTRAESVSMYDSQTVLFSCTGGEGAFLWNWSQDTIQKLPFLADAHTLVYRHSDNKFYGLFLDDGKGATTIAVAFDGDTGDYSWAYEPPAEFSRINMVTVYGDYAFVSSRAGNCLQKVDLRTSEIVWTLGSHLSDFHFFDVEGNFYDANKRLRNTIKQNQVETLFGTFQRQHKFQHLRDDFYSLFDNNFCSGGKFCNPDASTMVVIHLDAAAYTATEVFSWPTGDQAMIYGGADVLPSGNVLGNSYHKAIYPTNAEYMFHSNIWEVTRAGEVAWRASFKGLNPWDPTDVTSTYSHSLKPTDEAPVGWMIYSTERFYKKPLAANLCVKSAVPNARSLRVTVFNTIRSQDDVPGSLYLYNKADQSLLAKTDFKFQKSFFPVDVDIDVPESNVGADLVLMIVNTWQDGQMVQAGKIGALFPCDSIAANPRFV